MEKRTYLFGYVWASTFIALMQTSFLCLNFLNYFSFLKYFQIDFYKARYSLSHSRYKYCKFLLDYFLFIQAKRSR
jgi:hypothetical protein